ncbi:hypothetical protein [Streptococcus danieliae]|uniref:hypothetical protein n=1 Tax=Streptococcus danieliae TaxID=747656 RepID=UPI0021C650BB|nr:hypothetical protein [Streptococcus danieliae]MCU0082601.1 hypothetical protein [Streptococcus danieliae]
MKIDDKQVNVFGQYLFLVDGKWISVSPYDFHCYRIGDTVPQYVLERAKYL